MAMNDFLTMVHENFAPSSSGREQESNSQSSCPHHQHQQQQQARRRPRRLNFEKTKILNSFGVRPVGEGRPSGSNRTVVGGNDEDENETNWDFIPAPPITPPAEFRPNPDSCYRRQRRGKKAARQGIEMERSCRTFTLRIVYSSVLIGKGCNSNQFDGPSVGLCNRGIIC